MRKILSFFLCLALLISAITFVGCNKQNDNISDIPPSQDPQVKTSFMVWDMRPGSIVVPYVDKAWQYLNAEDANVADYAASMKNPNKSIRLNWDFGVEELPDKYIFSYYSSKDPSDVISVTLDKDARSYDLYNLYKDTEYFCSVTYIKGDIQKTLEVGFDTTDIGPRVMSVDGIYNVRDLGGYATESGKETIQGLLYRGGALTPYGKYDSQLSEKGEKVMREVMGIKTDIDVRGKGEESGNITESPITDAKLEYVKLIAYDEIFTVPENVRYVFSLLADKNNYPIYFHCTGGADRTGTLAFLINALLGVSLEDLIHDYEFTTFSVYGERNSASGTKYGTKFQKFLTTLNSYEGATLSQKTESYLLSIGVTKQEINNVKGIMLGEISIN